MKLQYIGQAGYLITSHNCTVAIDPYLSYSVDSLAGYTRNYAPPYTAENLPEISYVLLSHDHLDHTDPETLAMIAEACPKAVFCASAVFADKLAEYVVPCDRVLSLTTGENYTLGEFSVKVIPSAHEEIHPDENGNAAETGFIISAEGKKIYHGGDTCPFDGQAEAVYGCDAAIIPVNGRDERRHAEGVVGNMTPAEAAELTVRARIGITLPSHYDLYDDNGEKPENIVRAFEERKAAYKLMLPEEILEI